MNNQTTDLEQLAIKAYAYGFPLVFNLDQVQRYVTTGIGANPAAPFNTFSHARTLAGPDDKFVTINNDTVYSMAQIDLSAGPVLLTVPDTNERYYVLQFVSAWTDNFAYVGKRATGTAAGKFLLVPSGWNGTVPDDARKIEFPTTVASIVGRWAVEGSGDMSAVHALQDATTLTQLNSDQEADGMPDVQNEGLDDALHFWEKYRAFAQAYHPAPRDEELQASFAPLGLTAAEPIASQPQEVLEVLTSAYAKASALLEDSLRGNVMPTVDGWQYSFHLFDYNLDFYEVGTVDSDDWRISDPAQRLANRAGAALGGLWGNHGYEACYLATYTDADGEPLNGSNAYELKLNPTPPTGAFWSLTMYDLPNYYLVENPINRYSIGDRTPGTVTDDNGGITIHMSAREPEDANARVNWLPTPTGLFRPIIRVYIPGDALLDGTYTVPAIEKMG